MEDGIFEGLKVLDCASFIAAPAAATVLSDFGAEVIKIEPPGSGDPYRNLPNLPGYPRQRAQFRVAAGSPQQAQPRARSLQAGGPGGAASARRRGRRLHHQFSAGGARPARHHLCRTGAAQRAADLCVVHRLRRKGRGSQQARLRQQRLLGALGPDGSGARGPRHHAGAFGRRHGRPSLRDGAVRRDRHRALQARAHRQGLACQLEPDGQRHLGQRRAGAGQIMRREIRRAAPARARAERRDQSLQMQGRPLAHPVAAQRGAAMAGAGPLPRAARISSPTPGSPPRPTAMRARWN